jgi:nucleoside-diphosphate-sugar epimerase
MSVAVIGAGGFLGGHLAAHFEARGTVVRRLSYRPERHQAFLDEAAALLRQDAPDAILHAGGSQNGRDDAAALHDLALSNVVLPAALAALVREHAPACRLVTFGTSWQTGEDGAPEPFNAYAASKSAVEPFLDHFAMDGVRCATLRLYETYGPGDRRTKVMNLIADAIITRRDLAMSGGGQVVDLVHVEDAVAATEAALDLLAREPPGRHRAFAVRSGRSLTILELLETMLRVAGVENDGFIRPGIHPYRRRERFALFAGTQAVPGWAPRVALEDGLRRLIEDRRGRA